MAGGPRVTSDAGTRLLALLAVVLLLHLLALQWLARQLEQPTVLQPMATPMFTRLLRPQEPAIAPAPAAQAVRARPRRSAITSIAKSSATPAARAASGPAPDSASASASASASDNASASPTSEPAVEAAAAPAADSLAQPQWQEGEVASTSETAQGAASAAAAAASSVAAPAPAASATTAASAPAAAGNVAALESWPADTRLNYRLGGQFRSGELHGKARVQWQRQGDRYETRVDIDVTLLASLVLTSQGEVTSQGLLPRAYEELRRSGPRGVRLGDETITLADGRVVPRPQGVQDTASQFVELSHRFATGQDALEVGRSVSFWMARPGAVDLWTYDIVGREILQTPHLGGVEAFHLKPRPIANPRGNITAEMWFAPTLQYLPVRIRVTMGATYVDLVVDNIEQR